MKNTTLILQTIRFRGLLAALAFFICMAFAQSIDAATFTVDNNTDTAGQSACTAAPNDCSLRGAVTAANAAGDDTIDFAAGITNITLTTGTEIAVGNTGALTITGPGANVLTIDGGAGTNRIFFSNSAVFNLSGVTLTGGNGNGGGDGGAVYVFGGTATFNGVHFFNNTGASAGGGIFFNGGTNHRIENSTFSGNTVTNNGGATYVSGASLTVVNSTISGNSAGSIGGGILAIGSGTLTLRSVTITANSANYGGGVFRNTGTLDFGNSIIAGNTATTDYSEIWFASGTATSQGYNLVGDSAGDAAATGIAITYQSTDIRDNPPLLDPLANYGGSTPTHRLRAGSPAIDKGSLVAGVTTDQRGTARPIDNPNVTNAAGGNGSDIGAYEAALFDVFSVNKTADTNDGACTVADCTLREAVTLANASTSDSLITFNIPSASCASGVCTITLTNGSLGSNDAATAGTLTITNSTGASNLRISGNNASRVFTVGMGGNLTLNGLTVTNGFGSGANSDGSGIYNFQGTLSLTNSAVSGNGNATLNHGGGIYNNGGTLSLTNSTVSGNMAGNNGGGIYNETGTITLTNSTVSGNSGNFGGGIINSGGTLSLTNSTVSGNSAFNGGGGIRNDVGPLNLTSVTIANNSSNNGGGVSNNGGTATLQNTIVARNTANFPDFNGVIASTSQSNLIGDGTGMSGITNGTSGNQVGTSGAGAINPRLAPLGNYGGQTFTRALLSGSPAINAGNGALSGTPTTDQRGAARSGATDIGAFEVNAAFVAVLPSGTVSRPYNQIITPNNGTAVYTLASGTLPPGLTLTTAFAPAAVVAIQGTPTTAETYNFALTATEAGNTVTTNYQIVVLAPTAANVAIGGRVSADGRGLRNATVMLTDSAGNTRTARTGSFGYYQFEEVEAGQTYIISVQSKRFEFTPQVVNVAENIEELNFTALP